MREVDISSGWCSRLSLVTILSHTLSSVACLALPQMLYVPSLSFYTHSLWLCSVILVSRFWFKILLSCVSDQLSWFVLVQWFFCVYEIYILYHIVSMITSSYSYNTSTLIKNQNKTTNKSWNKMHTSIITHS